MKVKTINTFSGGLAEDVREPRTSTFTTCKGFDSSRKKNTLIPYGELETEALSSGDINDKIVSDIVLDSNGLMVAVGRNGAVSPLVIDLLRKDSASDIASTWTSFTTLSGAGGYRKNSLAYYSGKTYLLDASFNVRRYDGSWNNVGTVDVSSTWSTMLVPRPFVHPLDDILYFAGRQSLARVDGTTYSDITDVSVPNHLEISSLTDYGAYLAIAATPLYTGVSKVFLWNRDTTLTTFTESITWGEDSLLILENVSGTLVGVSINDKSYSPSTTYSSVKSKKLTIRSYDGGTPKTVIELDVSSNFSLKNFKQKVGEKLYFTGDYDDSLYVVYKDTNGTVVVSKDRFINNGDPVTTFNGFFIYGDYLFSMFDTSGGSGKFFRTKVTSSYTATSVYESLTNHSMDLEDRTKKKKLHFVSVAKSSTTGQLVVSVSVDGGAYQAVATLAASTSLVKKESRLASGSPFVEGYEFKFKVESTAGAELTELKYAYEVVEKNI